MRVLPEILDRPSEQVLRAGLRDVFEQELAQIWPGADEARRNGTPIPVDDVEFVVMPLERLGAPAGQSGSTVVFTYLRHAPSRGSDLLASSPPLVVKIGPASGLKREYRQAKEWPRLAAQVDARFARPIWFGEKLVPQYPEKAVLVAPFSSEWSLSLDGLSHEMRVNDIWRLLNDPAELTGNYTSVNAARDHLTAVLSLFDPVHRRNRAEHQREARAYHVEYKRYLRQTAPRDGKLKNEHIPVQLFGLNEFVEWFGKAWPNPVRIVDKVCTRGLTFQGCYGAIHGDLHPKNIALAGGIEYVIDFGWANSKAHVIKDFLLLDLNLRAITLPPQASEPEVLALAGFLEPGASMGSVGAFMKVRGEVIQSCIWSGAKRVTKDWCREYVLPLFLVGYGLLVYLDTARNQAALIASVLSAAEMLRGRLPELGDV